MTAYEMVAMRTPREKYILFKYMETIKGTKLISKASFISGKK
mgnify:CR=1 FL=1